MRLAIKVTATCQTVKGLLARGSLCLQAPESWHTMSGAICLVNIRHHLKVNLSAHARTRSYSTRLIHHQWTEISTGYLQRLIKREDMSLSLYLLCLLLCNRSHILVGPNGRFVPQIHALERARGPKAARISTSGDFMERYREAISKPNNGFMPTPVP